MILIAITVLEKLVCYFAEVAGWNAFIFVYPS